MPHRIVLAGGSGFLGQALARALAARGCEVTVLSRHPRPAAGSVGWVAWDGATPGEWSRTLEGADAVVNLTGRSVNCVHNERNRHEILVSRVASVHALGQALAGCRRPPAVWVQGGSLAIYGNAGDRVCTEAAPAANDFSAQVCRAWEAAFAAVPAPATRKVLFRIGIVLGRGGGGLVPLERLARRFLGGTVGSGRQHVSWLHLADMTELFVAALADRGFSGVYNATSPHPVTNAAFMRALRRAVGRPWSPPAPAWAVRIGARWFLRTDADLALTGRRAVPARLLETGFRFRFPELQPALADLFARPAAAATERA